VGTKTTKNNNKKKENSRVSSPQVSSKVANVGRVKEIQIKAPRKQFMPNGDLVIRHTEFLGKIMGSVNFTSTSYPINPGLPQDFKWASPIANQYESWSCRKLDYEFVNSKAGTYSGDIIMGIDYDPSDPSPFSEDELQSYWGAKTGQICQPMLLKGDMKALHKVPEKFTRIGAPGATEDLKFYDGGNFFIATTDCADTSTIGRLFCHYEFVLKTPQSNSSNVLSCLASSTSESPGAPLGTGIVSNGSNTLTWLSGTTFSFSVPGQYIIVWSTTGTTITAATKIASNNGASVFSGGISCINAGATFGVEVQLVKVASTSDVFTVSVTAGSVTIINGRVSCYTYGNT